MSKQFFYDLEAQFPLLPVKNIYHKMLDKYPKMKENDYRTALEGLFCWFEIEFEISLLDIISAITIQII